MTPERHDMTARTVAAMPAAAGQGESTIQDAIFWALLSAADSWNDYSRHRLDLSPPALAMDDDRADRFAPGGWCVIHRIVDGVESSAEVAMLAPERGVQRFAADVLWHLIRRVHGWPQQSMSWEGQWQSIGAAKVASLTCESLDCGVLVMWVPWEDLARRWFAEHTANGAQQKEGGR